MPEDSDVYMLCVDIAARRVPDTESLYWERDEIESDTARVLAYANYLFAELTVRLATKQ